MSKKIMPSLFMTTALSMLLPTMAMAQDAPAGDTASAEDDIIVTARRADERLQDVPVSVQVVTGDALAKLKVTSADEISKLAPGLTMSNNGTASSSITLRGVTWKPGSGTAATPIYFNEIGFDPGQTIASIFDIGQIEVLRGPQGTTRGAPSISGAVTMTTKKPNLEEIGGYVSGFYGSANHYDVQAAINLPIIKDMLAIRLATNIEDYEANRVYSVNSKIKPLVQDRSYRATVLFKPTNTLSFQAMYQRRKTDTRSFTQVVGTGSPGFAGGLLPDFTIAPAIAKNFNGPALTSAQRASVQDLPSTANDMVDLLTFNASWEVFGHTLSYNFGKQYNRGGASFTTSDPLNMIPGFESYTSPANNGIPKFTIQEVHLSSLPSENRPFDYDIGWYSKHSGGAGITFTAPTYLSGAFGHPATATPLIAAPGQSITPNSAYVLNSSTNIGIGQVFDSFYGDVKFHIDDKTELSGGLAIVRDRVSTDLAVTTFAAKNAVANAKLPLAAFCPFAGNAVTPAAASTIYTTAPNVCDVSIPAGISNSVQNNDDKYTAALYNFSLSHKFTDDVMVYATTGSSFRTGLPAINNTGLPKNLTTPLPEKAKSYELGIKTSWGRRLHINASAYQIDYQNQLTTFEGVFYFNNVTSPFTNKPSKTSLAFYRNVNSRVRGFELEVQAQPTDQLSLGVNMSYAQIKSKGGNVPCNNGTANANSLGDLTAANPIDSCPTVKGEVLNQESPFTLTANGGYTQPLGSLDAYFRFNVSYKGSNPNYGNFGKTVAGVQTFKSTPGYALVDLYAGLTGQKGAWDIGFYAKNVFDKQVELSRITPVNTIYGPWAVAPAGYDSIRLSSPREIGVSLRYAFGSR